MLMRGAKNQQVGRATIEFTGGEQGAQEAGIDCFWIVRGAMRALSSELFRVEL